MKVAKMKRFIAATIVIAGMSAAVTLPAWSDEGLPQDKAMLLKLNDAQLTLLRRAVRHCDDLYHTRHDGNFCVTSAVDIDVRQSGDAELQKLHWALTPSERYNDKRGMVELRRFLKD